MDTLHTPEPEFLERRRARRNGCEHSATVRKRGCFAVQGRVADLTADGCRIEGVGPFPADGELWVRLDGLEGLASRVIWSQFGLTGARFDRPLHPAVVARYLPAASRMTLVSETAQVAAPAPLDDELAALSRRARIMRGVAEVEQGPLAKVKRPTGSNVAALIKRQVARRAESRCEERFSDTLRTGPMQLTVADCAAEVRDVSASGLKLRVALECEIGEKVPVAFEGFEPMEGRVVWRRGAETGLSLPPESLALNAA